MKTRLKTNAYIVVCWSLLCLSCARPALDGYVSPAPPQDKAMTIAEVTSTISEEKSHAWAAAPAKVDGGGETFEHLFFLDRTRGWAASRSRVYRTGDGGQSWEQVAVNLPAQAEITDVNFASNTLGWLVAEKKAPDSSYRENHFWVFQTRDGGQTWRLNYEDKSTLAGRITFRDEKSGWLTGTRYIGISPLRFNLLVLHTSDQGEHWEDVSEGLNRLAAEGTDSVNDFITGIVSTTQSAATVLTQRGKVFRTTDRGRLWQQVAKITDEPPQTCICDLGVESNERLWIAGGAFSIEGIGSMILSETGNDSWMRYRLSGVYLADVLFLRKNEILAGGSLPADKTGRDLSQRHGVILYSSDAGQSWSIIYRTEQIESINKLAAPDPKHVIAVGEGGLIVRLQSS